MQRPRYYLARIDSAWGVDEIREALDDITEALADEYCEIICGWSHDGHEEPGHSCLENADETLAGGIMFPRAFWPEEFLK